MYISSLCIRNYRNFKSAKLHFNKGINTVLGENGSGKTNLFQALRILIDDSLPRYLNFSSSDFNRSIGDWSGHWIIISIEFDDLDLSEEAQVLAVHTNGHMDTEKKGSYFAYFRPKYKFRKELFDYSQIPEKSAEGLKLLLDTITIDDYELAYLCRGKADFSDDEIYRKYVGDFEKIEFPDPDNIDESVYGNYLPRELNIHNEVSCTFIKALRDVESDLRSYTNNPLIRLLRGKEKSVEIKRQGEIIERIDQLNEQISSLDEIKLIRDGIDNSIKDAVGTTYAPNIDIRSELPNEMERLFQSLRLWVGDPDEEGYRGKLWELSLGGANLIYLSLKLLEYEKVRTDRIANFLLIEEPESHIHTHIQKTLFNNLGSKKTQVIISTHSTHVSSVSKISSLNILHREKSRAVVFNPSYNLDPEEITRIERYLDAVRSNLLFAKGVILVEGDAEQILIPEMFKKVFGLSLDEIGISLINIGSTGFENVARLFHSDRIRKRCSILTDLDKSIVDLPVDPKGDGDWQKHLRSAQKSGEERRQRLLKFCEKNEFLKLFYSNYTFEVDFLMNGNSYEYSNCIDKIYKTDSKREAIKKKLESESIGIAGKEVLKIANHIGKGWLALLVTEQLNCNTYIPDYILKAISFSSPHIKSSSKVKAIKYRLNFISKDEDDPSYDEAKKINLSNKTDEEIIKEFSTDFDDDQLTTFLNLL